MALKLPTIIVKDVKTAFMSEKDAKQMVEKANALLKKINDNVGVLDQWKDAVDSFSVISKQYFFIKNKLDEFYKNGKYKPESSSGRFFSYINITKYNNVQFAIQSLGESSGLNTASKFDKPALTQENVDAIYKDLTSKKYNFKKFMQEILNYEKTINMAISNIKSAVEKSNNNVKKLNEFLPIKILIAKIAVDKVQLYFDSLYSYLIPENIQKNIEIGSRVSVPFGKGDNCRQGLVFEISDEQVDFNKLKNICAVLDPEPLVSVEMLELIKWMKNQFFCTYFEAAKPVLPPGINSENSKTIGDRLVKTVSIIPEMQNIKLTTKQKLIFDYLANLKGAAVKEICYFTGVSSALVNSMIKKGILKCEQICEYQSPKDENCDGLKHADKINLNQEQTQVFERMLNDCKELKHQISLIHGVTGSGKTMVLLKLIDYIISIGKDVIFMVPEIALTSQFIALFKGRYGNKVAVFHSGLSSWKRLDEWKRVKNGEAKIAIGTRSAVFAPFENLGLVIMDEEQEYTYKSDAAPRFHARDVAKHRCQINNCALILSSATPSLESYQMAKTGKYKLYTLKKRYANVQLPEVKVIDMNSGLPGNVSSQFSPELLDGIKDNIKYGQQSVLLLNRRGYHTFVKCGMCREIAMCPNCNISLNFHSANNRLMCHYCGYSCDFLSKCPVCGDKRLQYSGTGTQKAEILLAEAIPGIKILRMDADSTVSKKSFDEMFKKFADGEYNVLLGTQMVSKGLNFPNVTLVGILSADQILYSDDFRSYERAFSLMTQVIGRSGRGNLPGQAIIQTFTPENQIINMAAAQDYEAFFDSEIKIRQTMLYPPFVDLCIIGFVGINDLKTYNACTNFFEKFKQYVAENHSDLPLRVFTPTAMGVKKVCGKYRYKIIIKFKNNKKFREMLHKFLIEYGLNSKLQNIKIFVDMNPDMIL